MVTFTSLRASPLAFSGIADFLRQQPGAASSAGISFLTLPKLFAQLWPQRRVSRLLSLPHSVHRRGRERRGGFEQSKDAEERILPPAREVLHKSAQTVKWKGQNKGINKAQELSKVFSLSNKMDVCFFLCFPKLKWPGCEVVYKEQGQFELQFKRMN